MILPGTDETDVRDRFFFWAEAGSVANSTSPISQRTITGTIRVTRGPLTRVN
jgi:hypothetical protein